MTNVKIYFTHTWNELSQDSNIDIDNGLGITN